MENNSIDLKASLETLNKKDGGTYKCVLLSLTDNCKKKIFLEDPEIELIELFHKNEKKDNKKMPF